MFKKFYQFLEEEEAARIAALKKEQQLKYEVMRERMEKLTKNISMLSETIGLIKKDMETDDITFLQVCGTVLFNLCQLVVNTIVSQLSMDIPVSYEANKHIYND